MGRGVRNIDFSDADADAEKYIYMLCIYFKSFLATSQRRADESADSDGKYETELLSTGKKEMIARESDLKERRMKPVTEGAEVRGRGGGRDLII